MLQSLEPLVAACLFPWPTEEKNLRSLRSRVIMTYTDNTSAGPRA